MKKLFISFLLAIYIFSNSEARQFLKIPNLIEHFITHKEQNSQLTLFAFLKMHYIENHGKDADYKEDMKLPFKTHDAHCHSLVSNIISPPKTMELSFEKTLSFSKQKVVDFYTEPNTRDFYFTVFRPPVLS